MWVTAMWPPPCRASNLRVRPQARAGDSRGGGSKCSHDLCHHRKQGAVPAPSISHPSTPRRANAFPWDNPTNRLGFALIGKDLLPFQKPGNCSSNICFLAASQGGMCESLFSPLKQTGERAIKHQFKPDFSKWTAKKLSRWQTINRS